MCVFCGNKSGFLIPDKIFFSFSFGGNTHIETVHVINRKGYDSVIVHSHLVCILHVNQFYV